jgi:hypothetical protein
MNEQQLEQRRAFKEQLRARLRLVAAENAIPDSEMKWIGRLRHYDLVDFVRKHKLSWDWVLCGDLKGRLRMARLSS